MAFKMAGWSPFMDNRKTKKAKKLVRKHVGHTTVDSPSVGTTKSERKFPRSEKKINKAVEILRGQGYTEAEIEKLTGAAGYGAAMDWAMEPGVEKKDKRKKKKKKKKK